MTVIAFVISYLFLVWIIRSEIKPLKEKIAALEDKVEMLEAEIQSEDYVIDDIEAEAMSGVVFED